MRKKFDKLKKVREYSYTQYVFLCIIVLFVLGLLAGFIYSYFSNSFTTNSYETTQLKVMVKEYINSTNKTSIFIDNLIKHGKFCIIIWFSAFLPFGFIIAFSTFFIKCFSLGFTISSIFQVYGLNNGILCSIILLPQILIVIPSIMYIMRSSVFFAISFSSENKMSKTTIFIEYFVALLISLALISFSAFFESNILPNLINSISM